MPVHYGHLVRILHNCTEQRMNAALNSMELTVAQGNILGYLKHCAQPPCSRDIERAFHLSHPTVAGLLSRLERKGFLELRPDAYDRRCKRIYMLSKGEACHELIVRTIQENEAKLVSGFTEDEKAEFAALLTRAIRNMGASPCKLTPKEDPSA